MSCPLADHPLWSTENEKLKISLLHFYFIENKEPKSEQILGIVEKPYFKKSYEQTNGMHCKTSAMTVSIG